MMARRLLHALLRLYPQPWRIRYGSEFEALIEDVLSGHSTSAWRLAIGMVWGAIIERVHPSVRPSPTGAPGSEDYRLYLAMEEARLRRKLLRHRDLFGRRSLSDRLLGRLEPGEEVVASLDAVTAAPFGLAALLNLPWILVGTEAGYLLAKLVVPGTSLGQTAVAPLLGMAPLFLVLGLWCLVRRARRVTCLFTTRGLVTVHVDWFGRPTRVRSRGPAVRPLLLRASGRFDQVQLADERLWVARRSSFPLAWAGGVSSW